MLLKRGDIWHVRKQVGGVLIARSTKTSNKRIAEQLAAKWVAEVHQEVVVAGRKPLTVEQGIKEFLASRKGTAGVDSAEVKFRIFQSFAKQQLHEVDPNELRKHCIELVDTEKYSVNTINVSIIYWNALQNFCKNVGYTPGKKIKRLAGGSNRIRFLSDDEVAALLKALDPANFREKRKAQDNWDFTQLLLATGARENEIAKLKLQQIDMKNGTLIINRSKGGTDTTFKLTELMRRIIQRRLDAANDPLKPGQTLHGRAANGYLFPERAGGRYNNGWLAKAAKEAGLDDVSCHVMRHTAAVRWLKAGLTIVEVQHLLGHRNVTSTMCYLHVVPNLAAEKVANLAH